MKISTTLVALSVALALQGLAVLLPPGPPPAHQLPLSASVMQFL